MEENKTEVLQPGSEPEPGKSGMQKPFPTLGDLFAMLGIVLGLQVIMGVVLLLVAVALDYTNIADMEPATQGRFVAWGYLLSMSLSFGGVLYLQRMRGGGTRVANFSVRKLNPALLLWAFVFIFAIGVVLEPLLSLLPEPSTANLGRGIWTAVMLVCFAPVFEELICRGVVLGALRARYGVVAAWLGSSIFFAVLHLQPVLVVNAFVVGLIFGFIYIKTDSLWAVIILHAMNNALAYLFMSSGYDNVDLSELIGSQILYFTIYGAAVAVAAASGYMTWRSLKRLNEADKNRSEA